MDSKQIFQLLVEKLGNVSLEILYGSIAVLVSNVLKKNPRSRNAESKTVGLTRGKARALIRGGGYIHIFRFCPTNFFRNKIDFERNPPPPINALASSLV